MDPYNLTLVKLFEVLNIAGISPTTFLTDVCSAHTSKRAADQSKLDDMVSSFQTSVSVTPTTPCHQTHLSTSYNRCFSSKDPRQFHPLYSDIEVSSTSVDMARRRNIPREAIGLNLQLIVQHFMAFANSSGTLDELGMMDEATRDRLVKGWYHEAIKQVYC
ncbi:hypothetical protein BC829DRAFT_447304 [Chytridium lagenaria]|nr:hypothetical protein BC829DRAFT_447304 [Chytridium lagenaria]